MKVLIVMISLVFVVVPIFVSCGTCETDKSYEHHMQVDMHQHHDVVHEDAGIINTVCPIMGGAVAEGAEYVVEYDGHKIGLCCAGCVGAFNADPEKYMEKLMHEEDLASDDDDLAELEYAAQQEEGDAE